MYECKYGKHRWLHLKHFNFSIFISYISGSLKIKTIIGDNDDITCITLYWIHKCHMQEPTVLRQIASVRFMCLPRSTWEQSLSQKKKKKEEKLKLNPWSIVAFLLGTDFHSSQGAYFPKRLLDYSCSIRRSRNYHNLKAFCWISQFLNMRLCLQNWDQGCCETM